jgi:hypothetical protein
MSALQYYILNMKIVLFGEIFNIEPIKEKLDKIYNITYHKSCYIINSKIIDIIKSFFNDNEINIRRRKIIFFNNSIYIFYSKKVIIGKCNEILLFKPKYIIDYNSKEIFESQKKYLLENTIENYINNLECDLSNLNLQVLKDNKGNIGNLIILQNNTHFNDKSPAKKIKHKIISSINKQFLPHSKTHENFQLEFKDNQNVLNSKKEFIQVKTINTEKDSYKNIILKLIIKTK